MLTLIVEKRSEASARPAALRRSGFIPAVVYGAHHEATPISVREMEFSKVLREAGEATVVNLEGLGATLPTLIHEVDLDPLTSRPRHIDFYAVTKGEKIDVEIPLEFVGESPAVKSGANLVKVLHELEVEADPMNLPHSLQIDISVLAAVDDRICAKDIVLPAGVRLLTDAEEVIVLVQEVEKESTETGPADISSIEVQKKGKEEAEGKSE